jgi:hypothetical protein
MQITETIFTLLQMCNYPFETVRIGNERVLKNYPTMDDVLTFLRKEDVYITALPFRDAEEGSKLYFYYSVIDVNDFNDEDDILCDEHHLGVSDVDYGSYDEALISGVESYLKYKSRQIRSNREVLLSEIIKNDQELGLYD